MDLPDDPLAKSEHQTLDLYRRQVLRPVRSALRDLNIQVPSAMRTSCASPTAAPHAPAGARRGLGGRGRATGGRGGAASGERSGLGLGLGLGWWDVGGAYSSPPRG
jgi:hypothetical protein